MLKAILDLYTHPKNIVDVNILMLKAILDLYTHPINVVNDFDGVI